MGLSNNIRKSFITAAGAALLTAGVLTGCDSGGSGMDGDDGGNGEIGASAQTTVLSEQRGFPIRETPIDFQAGDISKTDATDQGTASFS